MCSINGVLRFNQVGYMKDSTLARLKEIIIKGEARGKDSFGYTIFNSSKSPRSFKYIGKPSDIGKGLNFFGSKMDGDFLIINNNRAEPTTEFVNDKKLTDVQPYHSDNIWIVHNGTIANDKELIEKYNLDTGTKIDSAVIPWVLEHSDWTSESLVKFLQDELIGSYALAAYNTKLDKFILATNYKPLSILYDREDDILYFSSLEDYLVEDDYNRIFNTENFIEVKPYTLLTIDLKTRKIDQFDLYRKKEGKKKALVCASAGMDSTVAATWAKKEGYDITLLHFQYQCRASDRERECIENISKFLEAPLVTINADFFKGVLGGSNLYGEGKIAEGEPGAELAIEWVPARNLIFLSIAAGYAEAKGIDAIILGGNLEESGAYSDNELIFQKKFGQLLPNALNLQNKVEVLTPIANMMKHDIVKLGIDFGAPLHLTWSCYENGELHCSECGPCFMRRTAFKMNNIAEVIKYAK